MKKIKLLNVIILFFVALAMLSCEKEEEDVELTNILVGEWQRSDFSNTFEYKLIFYSDNSGVRTQREGDLNIGVISNAVMFDWNTNGDHLELDFEGERFTTHFSIDANGYLSLHEFSNFYFVKLVP